MVRFLLLYVVLAFAAGPQLGVLSGRDTLVRWIVTGCVVAAAAIGAAFRAGPASRGWLELALRASLAVTMLVHGLGQLVPTIPEPTLHTLTLRLGELTRAELLTASLGYSAPYQMFNGALETAAGLLLLFPVTALLGAVISGALLTMTAIMAFCYDVPYKLVTLQALLLAGLLIAPQARRLVDALVRNRVVEPADDPAAPRRAQRIVTAGGLALAVVLLAANAVRSVRGYQPSSPLYGVWNVEELTVNGEESGAWRMLIVDHDGIPRLVSAAGIARLCTLTLRPAETHVLIADGPLDGATVHAKLRRMQLLQDRFHWLLPPEEEE